MWLKFDILNYMLSCQASGEKVKLLEHILVAKNRVSFFQSLCWANSVMAVTSYTSVGELYPLK